MKPGEVGTSGILHNTAPGALPPIQTMPQTPQQASLLKKIGALYRSIILSNPRIPLKVIPSQLWRMTTDMMARGENPFTGLAEVIGDAKGRVGQVNAQVNVQPTTLTSRIGSGIERYANRNIQVTHKPLVEAYQDFLLRKGVPANEAEAVAKDISLMSDNRITKSYEHLKTAADTAGGKGLGDILLPITKVPVNVVIKELGAGDVGIARDFIQAARIARTQPEAAKELVKRAAWNLLANHSTAVILAQKGLVTGEYDPKLANYYKQSNIPWNSTNISGIMRAVTGGDSTPQAGDFWVSHVISPEFHGAVNQEVSLYNGLKEGKTPAEILAHRESGPLMNLPGAQLAAEFKNTAQGQGWEAAAGNFVKGLNPLSAINTIGRQVFNMDQANTKSKDYGDIASTAATGGLGAPAKRDMFGEPITYNNSVFGGVSSWKMNDANADLKNQLSMIKSQVSSSAPDFFPKSEPTELKFRQDGKEVKGTLTTRQQEIYMQEAGNLRKSLYTYTLNAPIFQTLTPDDKARVLSKINSSIDHSVAITQFGAPQPKNGNSLLTSLTNKDGDAATEAVQRMIEAIRNKENPEGD
jgi:hypothetical protein